MIAGLADQHRVREAVAFDTAAKVLADLADREPHITLVDVVAALDRYPLGPEEKQRVCQILFEAFWPEGDVS